MKEKNSWYRMWKILSFAFSMLIQIYWFRIRKKSEHEWEVLWDKLGRQFRQTLFELEGVLIKVGQLISIRKDIIPSAFIEQIEDLVDQVPSSSWEDIQEILEREWGKPIESVLRSVETKAIASASIGEVYRGTLLDGTDVAIKVQRPSIPLLMKIDFRALRIIMWFAQYVVPIPKGFINYKTLFEEVKYVIERELDFKRELETITMFRQRFKSLNKLLIPKAYPTISSSKVLVMEWVEGVRITDVDFLDASQINRQALAQHLMRVFLPQWLEAGIFHADPHSGNVLVKADGTIILLDFGMVGEISRKDAANLQVLVQAILLKNFAQATEILRDLGFLLPGADPKIVENLLREAVTMDLNQMKEMDLLVLKNEMNDLLQALPVQVPTRFTFLGRSFLTIEGMLLTIDPDKEVLDIVKPAFADWLAKGNSNKWQLLVKWMNALPIFKVFNTLQEAIEAPQRIISQKETLQQREFYFAIYENQKKQYIFVTLLSIIGAFLGIYLKNLLLLEVTSGLGGLALLFYIITSWRQKKWLKILHKTMK